MLEMNEQMRIMKEKLMKEEQLRLDTETKTTQEKELMVLEMKKVLEDVKQKEEDLKSKQKNGKLKIKSTKKRRKKEKKKKKKRKNALQYTSCNYR
tara:strand:- start:186 stop:470 length:285 start_codon:yes stop_codon:yes gene_type:complete